MTRSSWCNGCREMTVRDADGCPICGREADRRRREDAKARELCRAAGEPIPACLGEDEDEGRRQPSPVGWVMSTAVRLADLRLVIDRSGLLRLSVDGRELVRAGSTVEALRFLADRLAERAPAEQLSALASAIGVATLPGAVERDRPDNVRSLGERSTLPPAHDCDDRDVGPEVA